MSRLLDLIIPHLVEEDFVFKKNYKIRNTVDASYGKWPQTYGNSFFTDSRWLTADFVDMAFKNINTILKRNKIDSLADLTGNLSDLM